MKSLDHVRLRLKGFVLLVLCGATVPSLRAQLVVDSFDGAVTQNEINSFRTFVEALVPASSNSGNAWSQAGSGEAARGMGLVYEATGDIGILDQEIRFCDALLAERDDLARLR